jgi:hypothetical protein
MDLLLNKTKLTEKDLLKQDSIAATDMIMRFAAENEHECNIAVAGGKQAWRILMTRTFKDQGLLVSDDICDRVFEWMCHCVREREYARNSGVESQQIAGKALDHTEEITPPTALEIIDGLELDSSGTSDDGRRFLYGRDGAAEKVFEQLKDELREQVKQGDTPWKPDATRNVRH